MQPDHALRMIPAITEWCVGPALAVPSRSLGGGWSPGLRFNETRPADKPLDGFDRLPFDKLRVCDTAGTLGALSLSNG